MVWINFGWLGLLMLSIGIALNTHRVESFFVVFGMGICAVAAADWLSKH